MQPLKARVDWWLAGFSSCDGGLAFPSDPTRPDRMLADSAMKYAPCQPRAKILEALNHVGAKRVEKLAASDPIEYDGLPKKKQKTKKTKQLQRANEKREDTHVTSSNRGESFGTRALGGQRPGSQRRRQSFSVLACSQQVCKLAAIGQLT